LPKRLVGASFSLRVEFGLILKTQAEACAYRKKEINSWLIHLRKVIYRTKKLGFERSLLNENITNSKNLGMIMILFGASLILLWDKSSPY